MELPLRSNDPLPMVAGVHRRNKRNVAGTKRKTVGKIVHRRPNGTQ
ncbi:MAG: hypothetical protein LBQ54_02945 [Planctomycetaceae bacterium]|nr:hypothetical protein [Planctomycetaceae bacterium]